MAPLTPTTWTPGDAEAAWQVVEEAFAEPAHDDDRAIELATVDAAQFLVVKDEGRVVATGGSFALDMTMPGGRPAPIAGITWISVQATHRRRGLLTAMMTRLLAQASERGEPLAALYASEGAIYQRFGFGPASWHLALTVPRGAALTGPVGVPGLRRVEPTAELLAPAYDAHVATTPGSLRRDAAWWATRLHDPEHGRRGASRLRCVRRDAGDGYVLYSVSNDDLGCGTVAVRELVATSQAAHAALWAYLLDLDLTTSVRAKVAADDPLLQRLAEPRAAQGRLSDSLWLRPVDVGAALSARSYAADIDVVLDVADATCGWNEGRWRLSTGATGAVCARTTDSADLALDVGDLGAALLGGTALQQRAGAGRITELRPGALQAASTAFGPIGRGPWNPMSF